MGGSRDLQARRGCCGSSRWADFRGDRTRFNSQTLEVAAGPKNRGAPTAVRNRYGNCCGMDAARVDGRSCTNFQRSRSDRGGGLPLEKKKTLLRSVSIFLHELFFWQGAAIKYGRFAASYPVCRSTLPTHFDDSFSLARRPLTAEAIGAVHGAHLSPGNGDRFSGGGNLIAGVKSTWDSNRLEDTSSAPSPRAPFV